MMDPHRSDSHRSLAAGRRHDGSIRGYFVVYAVLLGLLVVTVGAAFLHLGALSIVVALLIAAIKAVLVVLYFMHVNRSSVTTRVFVVAGIFWLGILFTLTFSDYLTRDWLPLSRGWAGPGAIPPPPGAGPAEESR